MDITRILISHNFNFAISFSLLIVLLLIELNSSINSKTLITRQSQLESNRGKVIQPMIRCG